MRLLRNLRLTAATVFEHLGDDPVLLILQISRRLPQTYVGNAAAVAAKIVPGPVVAALAAHLQGFPIPTGDRHPGDRPRSLATAWRSGTPGDRPRSLATAWRSGNQSARLADIALAAGDTIQADALLEHAGAAPATRARRRWYDGDMTGAVAELRSAGLTARANRVESELRVFEGWTPQLARADGYEPRENTVLHVLTNSLPHTGSGYAQRSHSILKAQHKLGWTVHAATRLGYPVQVGKLLADDVDVLDGVTYHRLIPDRMMSGFDERLQQQASELLALAFRLRPSVLHTTTHFVNGLVVRKVARALGIPWVYEVRGQLADTWASTRNDAAKSSERYKLFSEREADATESAALVVTLGEAMKQQILRAGDARGDVLLCPNAVGDEFLDEPMDSRAARNLLGLSANGVFIGTVSSMVEYEGLDNLLRAFALLALDHSSLHCLMVGGGSAAPALMRLARELGIEGRVTFTGRVPREQAHLYHQALDIFVVPRKDLDVTRTVTPLKPVEAMACARPVVASDLPALREIVEDGLTGTLVAPGSVEALASAVAGLIDDDGARLTPAAVSMGATGRRKVMVERTWTRSAEAVLGAYAGLGHAF
ncbi:glycosyltransferase family 4 protein [Arthrobacter sp. H5]|uniref:glycosyltransferase family 4 protein n=1 Tax=Arthrobacter sp. H5 TaxID=1267973 RepID=UPI00056223FB|nr:glycosyltransferase family 4 protein [Arthrobacter sp. H5]